MSVVSKKNSFIIVLGILLLLMGAVFVTLRIKTKVIAYPVTERILVNTDSILIQNDSIVLPVVYRGNPDMRTVKGKERKERFLHMMLPSILIAQRKLEQERERIVKIERRLNAGQIQAEDSLRIDSLLTYYKCQDLNQVINNLHFHPVSIVLAQAAIESGWGTSRFFLEANNVFGIWSYNKTEDRIQAFETRGENSIYLRKYDNLYGSVYDYLITVARAPAYRQLREVRLESDDPYELIQYLVNYSELREEYVKILHNVIRQNDLTKFDHYQLVNIDENDPIWKSL